ncbi:MAG: type I glyceraldehyde-3-phosphate dehydrogenase [Parcubacteria group bacterium]|nr:type I glyceraldehyde-3-phosphate dehydrogenase [Parcubacteria group bacterium]
MVKVAINGFGRIGRGFFRLAYEHPEIEIVGINDLSEIENLDYLLEKDTVYGKYDKEVDYKEGKLIVGGKEISFTQEKDPTKLPWKDLEVDVVVESTGVFKEKAQAEQHIQAGAKRVVISAPSKDTETILVGINEEKFEGNIITNNGSCTTNAVAPAMKILCDKIGIEKAVLNTIHSYTTSQSLVDASSKKDFRRGRAAARNIVPTSTGAAKAVAQVLEPLNNIFDGMALRVPTVCGSIADVTFIASKDTSAEEINKVLEEASQEENWKGIIRVSTEPLVSTDIVGEKCPSIVDSVSTNVIDGNLVKVLIWYDNELGYSWTLVEHALRASRV